MGFLDTVKKNIPGLKKKAADLADSQNDKIDQGIDKAADLADKATKGKYADQIDAAADRAQVEVDKFADDGKTPPPQP